MFTATVIFLSKYFSKAKENKNRENTEINIEGINVNNEKKVIYFLLAYEPLTLISCFKDFLISKKISKKNNIKSARSTINSICKLNSFNFIKLFSIKVKNVTNPTVRVKMNITIKKIFLLMNASLK